MNKAQWLEGGLKNKWARRLAWALGALLLLWVLAWLAVPPLVKGQLEKHASEALGRKVTVGQIDFRPWSLELTLRDLAIASADGTSPQLAIGRLYIDGELQSLLRLAPVVDAIVVDAPQVRLRHLGGGRYDIDDVLQKLSSRPEPDPQAEPQRFALYNLAVQGGTVEFQDDAVGKAHSVRDLTLGVPFLSNLKSQRDVKVAPRLAFVLNGSRFDSSAETTPFDASRKTDATLRLAGFNLAPYLAYLPESLPVRLQSAVVDADVRVNFEQAPQMAVRLSGTVQVSGVRATDRNGAPLLDFRTLKVGLADVRPLEQSVKLSDVTLEGPTLSVARGADGRINLLALAGPAAAAPKAAAPAKTSSSASPAAATPPTAPAWRLEVGKLALVGATASWQDATLKPAAELALTDFGVDATQVMWPATQAIPFSGTGKLAGSTLAFKGEATAQAAQLDIELDGLPLQAGAPYLRQHLEPTLTGTLAAQASLAWTPDALKLKLARATLSGVNLAQGRTSLASLNKLEIADAEADLAQQTLAVGRLALTQPKIKVEREADGVWMYERWLRTAATSAPANAPASASASVEPASTPAPKPGPKPWAVTLADFSLDGGAVSLVDRSHRRPVALEVSALKLQAGNIAPDSAKPGPFNVSARIAAARGEPGRLDFRGQLAAKPVAVQGRLDAQAIPLHAFAAYLQQFLNIELLRADASFRGNLRFAQMPAGPSVTVTGDTSLEDFRANTMAAQAAPAGAPSSTALTAPGFAISEELLSWKTLSLRGLDVQMAPGTMTRVSVRETALADFYARVTINPSGRINLQDLVRRDGEPASPEAPAATPANATAPSGSPQLASSAASSQPAATAPPQPEGPPADIRFGPISLVNGRVLFSDYFVRPNYSANLSELTGRLGAFSSLAPQGEPEMADLELRGRAEGTASLEITGKLNPLAKPIALDVVGKVRDLELSPLSPYSVKYAGHGIERGKLSVDVAYKVLPNGQLTANNKLVLNQLVFSDPVPGAPNSLPVKLAVALLADRNGVIDVDLPISGSLNDPQFSLGPVIFKVIVNLIVKAITSPFSLLAGAFGGGSDELAAVAFPAGVAVITPEAQQGLDKIAKALADRPALKMTVVGRADLEAEREGYKRARLGQLVEAEKRRATVLAGQNASGPVTVSEAEYPALLRAVYRRADMPKPRNLVGMTKDIPQQEMEALLLANIPVSEDTMRELAVQRGVAVKDYLAGKQVAPERLFLGAGSSSAQAATATAPATPAAADAATATAAAAPATPASAPAATSTREAWKPRADLSLATR